MQRRGLLKALCAAPAALVALSKDTDRIEVCGELQGWPSDVTCVTPGISTLRNGDVITIVGVNGTNARNYTITATTRGR